MRNIDKIVFCFLSLIIILDAVFSTDMDYKIMQICLGLAIILFAFTHKKKEKAK